MGDMSSPDDSVILAQLRSDVAAWEREATRHHPERAALYATIALAKWLHDVARRAEVAGLVELAKQATRHARPCVPGIDPDAEDCGCHVRQSRTAIDRLARLAGGGA